MSNELKSNSLNPSKNKLQHAPGPRELAVFHLRVKYFYISLPQKSGMAANRTHCVNITLVIITVNGENYYCHRVNLGRLYNSK